ncbi:GGDEF domain-containing protein [Brucella grignonensis]|uniref:diguanylate cyclase n=1 Tax=Brucella grignonensis TaxID=94627 RepID=A0A256EZB8_9HYPH|nr:GGDEF domain-containing protein [Brucella grignonensis]OYR07820.1 diguanylate cyclase domain protein [Brucella grignonensis]
MDAKSVFLTVTLIILVNGGMLSAINRDFPVALRPAAMSWMWATLFVALGCATFAAGKAVPPNVTVTVANACLFAGVCLYYTAIRQFHNLKETLFPWVLFILAMMPFTYFVVFAPNTLARIVIVSIVWIWLMAASIRILASRRYRDGSRSRVMLLALYIAALSATAARALFYLGVNPGATLDIASNSNWMNSVTPLFLAILPIIGTTTFILMCTDQIRRRWERAASNDYLTGLPNRRTLNEVGSERFEATGEREAHHAVAVLDIDNFKLINDSHGHDIGDKVLKHVAFQLQDSMEQGDFVARSGGEEFVIIFGEANSELATTATEAIRKKIERDVFVIGDVKIKVTVSIGVAKQKNTLSTFDSILRQADMALYEAKSQGKNCVETASS